MRMQQTFDLWQAENRLDGALDKIPVHNVPAE